MRLVACLLLLCLGLACSEASEPGPTASGPEGPAAVADPERLAQSARLARFREAIPERSSQGCASYVESPDPAFAARCEPVLAAVYERIAQLAESQPVALEKRILGLSSSCLRLAHRRARSEAAGRSESELFLEGLEETDRCLDEQVTALRRAWEARTEAS